MKNPVARHRVIPRSRKSGLPPGTPVFVGEQKLDRTRLQVIDYTSTDFEEIADAGLDDCVQRSHRPSITWINVIGVHDIETLERIGQTFSLHPLTLEDIANTHQRPKTEIFDDYVFFAFKMLLYDEQRHEIVRENVSLVLGNGFVLLFQERDGDVLDPLRERIRSARGSIRSRSSDYLAYAIMDSVIDGYFLALEKLGDYMDALDEEILTAPGKTHMRELHRLKRELVYLRKAIWPLREVIATMQRAESGLIGDSIRPFLRDLHDHTVQVIDLVDTRREILTGLHDTFLSSMSNRMNEVMKLLTIMGSIFIPLTFLAGIYGMNFEYMPELEWKWGYFVVLGVMFAIAVGLLLLFRKRNWL